MMNLRRVAIGLVGAFAGLLGGQFLLPAEKAEAASSCWNYLKLVEVTGPQAAKDFWEAEEVEGQLSEDDFRISRGEANYILQLEEPVE